MLGLGTSTLTWMVRMGRTTELGKTSDEVPELEQGARCGRPFGMTAPGRRNHVSFSAESSCRSLDISSVLQMKSLLYASQYLHNVICRLSRATRYDESRG